MVRRVLVGLGVAAALAGLLGACGGSPEEVRGAEAICRGIEQALGAQQGVVAAHADFVHSSVNPGDASVQLQVGPGADPAVLADLATRLVWQSHLDPLRRINVTIGTRAPVTYALPAQKAELEAKYGERPYTDRPYSTGAIVATLAGLALVALLLVAGLIVLVVVLARRRRVSR